MSLKQQKFDREIEKHFLRKFFVRGEEIPFFQKRFFLTFLFGRKEK
jgi:hypothetical protein